VKPLETRRDLKNAADVDEALTILIVEDDPIYADFLARTLREAGHDVDHVTTGAAAERHCGAQRPDVVMLDLGLPDGNGYDIALALRKLLPPTSIIIVLTAALHPELDRADAVGIDMVLTKPIETKVVAGMIELVRARRRRRFSAT
jgi:DNA-binding response OmpR family regulator